MLKGGFPKHGAASIGTFALHFVSARLTDAAQMVFGSVYVLFFGRMRPRIPNPPAIRVTWDKKITVLWWLPSAAWGSRLWAICGRSSAHVLYTEEEWERWSFHDDHV
jgi:hypothetical protein